MADPQDTAAMSAVPAAALDGVANLATAYTALEARQRDLTLNANKFASAMTSAFSQAVVGGKNLDDVLKNLALRMSDLVLKGALQPVMQQIAGGLTGGISSVVNGLFGGSSNKGGGVTAYATGGVIGTPTYFPMSSGVGLVGEAGPEAILPLARGADGRLGVAAGGGGASVTVQIVTPDVDGFRRSEVYLAGQIARAVARGQRDL
jgi:phage-related minor tail protein